MNCGHTPDGLVELRGYGKLRAVCTARTAHRDCGWTYTAADLPSTYLARLSGG